MVKLVFPFAFALCVIACVNENKAPQVASEIAAFEQEVGSDPQVGPERLQELLAKYEEYASLPDADTQLVVNHWLRSADVAVRLQEFERALTYYDNILSQRPLNPKTPRALFMKAYVYDNHMGRLDKAKEAYELFLEKYPEDDFADDAQFSLKNLGKSPEEIIKEFEAQQQ